MQAGKNPYLPDIYHAKDYRSFLKEYFEIKKGKNSKYSFSVFSRFLGFTSRSFIQDVISGKKNISLESLDKFRVLFPRKVDSFEHFRKLVLRDQTKKEAERSYYDSQILFERSKNKREMPSHDYSLYSDWYFVPIFFLACDPSFQDGFEWISKKMLFKVSKENIQKAVEILYKLKYWEKDATGKTRPRFDVVSSHAEADRNVLKIFHSRMIELARQACELQFNERILNATTLLIDAEQLSDIREKIFKFKETELAEYQTSNIKTGQKKRVYQFQFAVFPLTHLLGK